MNSNRGIPIPGTKKLLFECLACGTEFSLFQSTVAHGRSGHFCSVACKHSSKVFWCDPARIRIPLFGAQFGTYAVISPEDHEIVNAFRWYGQSAGYATSGRTGNEPSILMHRLILDAPHEFDVDHINGIPLDNRRENLRLCTPQENLRNQSPRGGSSQFKGVRMKRGVWRAAITVDRQEIYLGTFHCETTAARAYDAAARERFGEFARLNFPD